MGWQHFAGVEHKATGGLQVKRHGVEMRGQVVTVATGPGWVQEEVVVMVIAAELVTTLSVSVAVQPLLGVTLQQHWVMCALSLAQTQCH